MPFLLANWKLIGIGVLMLIFAVVLGAQRSQIKSLQKDLSAAIIERDQALASYNLLAVQVVKQNAAINQLTDRAKQAEKKAAYYRKQIKPVVDHASSVIDSAMSHPPAKTCDEAVINAQGDLRK